jgi:hypothetical protein
MLVQANTTKKAGQGRAIGSEITKDLQHIATHTAISCAIIVSGVQFFPAKAGFQIFSSVWTSGGHLSNLKLPNNFNAPYSPNTMEAGTTLAQ